MPIDIFSQIGFVVLVALAAKNAILIVEYARDKRKEGMTDREATLEACRLRLRPILMTVVGVHPRRLSAGGRHGRRLGNAALAGHGGLQRHDRRDVLRHLPDAGVLLRHHLVSRAEETGRAGAENSGCARQSDSALYFFGAAACWTTTVPRFTKVPDVERARLRAVFVFASHGIGGHTWPALGSIYPGTPCHRCDDRQRFAAVVIRAPADRCRHKSHKFGNVQRQPSNRGRGSSAWATEPRTKNKTRQRHVLTMPHSTLIDDGHLTL